MACPKCDNPWVDVVDEDYSDPDRHVERYECPECGTIFTWESVRTIEHESEEKPQVPKKVVIPDPEEEEDE